MFRLTSIISPNLSTSLRTSNIRKLHQNPRLLRGAASPDGCISTAAEASPTQKQWKEVQIPVPWGHISGKWWGPADRRPLLGLHGWQDNAGTWDRLAPLLPPHVSVLAVDLPGHGLSSHYHPGRGYHFLEYVVFVRRIMNYYSWPQVSLLTHSLGSIVSFVFSAVYPELVDNYIAIDAMKPYSAKPNTAVRKTGKFIDRALDVNRLDPLKAPSYPYEEAQKRLVEGTKGSITVEASANLLARGLEETSSGMYRYRRDPRLKVEQIVSWTHAGILELASSIRCNVLHINAVPGLTYDAEEKHREVNEVIGRSAKSYQYVDVEGTHHLHLTHPESVAPIINQFLHKYGEASAT